MTKAVSYSLIAAYLLIFWAGLLWFFLGNTASQ